MGRTTRRPYLNREAAYWSEPATTRHESRTGVPHHVGPRWSAVFRKRSIHSRELGDDPGSSRRDHVSAQAFGRPRRCSNFISTVVSFGLDQRQFLHFP